MRPQATSHIDLGAYIAKGQEERRKVTEGIKNSTNLKVRCPR